MVSHPYRCIFIEIPKTASTSVREVIGRPAKPHLDLVEIRTQLELENTATAGETFRSYFKFSIVRNPWDRVLSLYQRREGQQLSDKMSFEEFVEWVQLSSDTCIHPSPHRYQADWLKDERGEIAVDFVGKFENLEEDWKTIAARIGAPAALPHTNRNAAKRGHYRDYYTPAMRDVVSRKFAEDVERFGYEF